jgi:hypothetical protein
MTLFRQTLTAALLCAVGTAAWAQSAWPGTGTWSGPVGERSAGSPGPGSRLDLRLDGGDKRFSVNLSSPEGTLLAGEFQTGGRGGVFVPPQRGGFMSYVPFVGRGGAAKPLEGQPLVWARRSGEDLVLYSLVVRDGPYRLDRVVLTPAGERLRVAFERREHEKAPERFSATLERQRP